MAERKPSLTYTLAKARGSAGCDVNGSINLLKPRHHGMRPAHKFGGERVLAVSRANRVKVGVYMVVQAVQLAPLRRQQLEPLGRRR